MTGYAFISYSHRDAASYVPGLSAYLRQAGVDVWYDRSLASGQRWAERLIDMIDECDALIAVMTPDGAMSDWTHREIDRAHQQRKYVLPLLLRGYPYGVLDEHHYEDVTSGAMPGNDFIVRLMEVVAPKEYDYRRRYDWALQVGKSGDYIAAVRALKVVVEDDERHFGRLHMETLTSRLLHATYIGEDGRFNEAANLLYGLYADYLNQYGSDDPASLDCLEGIAHFVYRGGSPGAAADLQRSVASDRAATLGREHVDTLRAQHNLAGYLGESGHYVEAIRLIRSVIEARTRVLGHDHPDTVDSRDALAHFERLRNS